MRRARVRVDGEGYYHVMSRCALQERLLSGEAKGMFLRMLRRAERFSGVRVLDYCVMDNHFHILVKVPARREVPDAELDERVRALYGEAKAERMFARWGLLAGAGGGDAVERERDALRKEYIAEWRRGAEQVLENTYIVTPDGKKRKLQKRS